MIFHWWAVINTHVKSCTRWIVLFQDRMVPCEHKALLAGFTLELSIRIQSWL